LTPHIGVNDEIAPARGRIPSLSGRPRAVARAAIVVDVGPDRMKHLRNAGIVVLLALIVWLVPGGDRAGVTISSLLGIVFAGGLLFLGFRMYMEHRETIFGLEERQRGILYASLALGTVAIVGTRRMWATGAGALVWLVLIALAGYGLVMVWRAYRTY
jgi:hypothetical protein